MPSFLHPALFWTLGLPTLGVVALPVLIHLINMMRHRRVEWAAMEFLLVSQKKHRTWVILKQLLLLLLRMLAVAAVVLMVAQPRLQSQLEHCWAARARIISCCWTTVSRCRTAGPTPTPFRRRRRSFSSIGANAARQDRLQSFTLLRFSRVGRPQRPTEPDLIKEPVNSEFGDKLEGAAGEAQGDATGPRARAGVAGDCPIARRRRRRASHPLSDLRFPLAAMERSDRPSQGAAAAEFERHGNPSDQLRRPRPVRIWRSFRWRRPKGFARRACRCRWTSSFGTSAPTPVRNVSVALGEDGHGRPAVTLAEIPPGKTASESIPGAVFRMPGRTRSPRGWKATPWRPTTTAIARSTCRRTCRCC